jgi:hypothetical protein
MTVIRLSLAAASLALLAATAPSSAQYYDGYAAALQHQYGAYTYNSYHTYNSYSQPSYSYSYDGGRRYGYGRYGYSYRRYY